MYIRYLPRKSTNIPEKIAIGIVTSPSCFIGIINNKIPIIEGIINFKLSFKVTLLLSLNGFNFEISILSPLYLYISIYNYSSMLILNARMLKSNSFYA